MSQSNLRKYLSRIGLPMLSMVMFIGFSDAVSARETSTVIEPSLDISSLEATTSESPVLLTQSVDVISAGGRYTNLQQVLNCPADEASYGSEYDYGYWSGGAWCGQTGEAGYWVWAAPNWDVWGSESGSAQANASSYSAASVGGKYSNLKQVLTCAEDRDSYGTTHDYGYWSGGAWCGQTGEAGYWSWVAPNWYVWGNEN